LAKTRTALGGGEEKEEEVCKGVKKKEEYKFAKNRGMRCLPALPCLMSIMYGPPLNEIKGRAWKAGKMEEPVPASSPKTVSTRSNDRGKLRISPRRLSKCLPLRRRKNRW